MTSVQAPAGQGAVEMSIERFAKLRGLTPPSELSGVIHAGLMGTPESGSRRRRYLQAIDRTAFLVDQTKAAYRAAIECGDVRLPRQRSLAEIASGDPDLPATQAAQRILAKYQERARATGSAP